MLRQTMKGQKGFNLIEITISSMLIAVSLLAALSMQNVASRDAVEARQTTHANMLAMDMLERIQLNSHWLRSSADNSYQVNNIVAQSALTPPACVKSNDLRDGCNGPDVRQHDMYQWRQLLLGLATDSSNQPTASLPEIDGCIGYDQPSGEVTVVVRWTGQYDRGDSANSTKAENQASDSNNALASDQRRSAVATACGKADQYRRLAIVSTILV